MKIPKIVSDFKPIFTPSRFGDYVNDHAIVYGNGEYRLFGITSFTGSPLDEKYFVNAYTKDILTTPFTEQCTAINTGTLAWSPCVVKKDQLFYMFYGPSPTKLAVSFDFIEWMGQEVFIKNNPPMSVHRDHFVMKYKDKWLMYAVGIKDKRGCVSCLESEDLINWNFVGYPLTLGKNATLTPGWGALESPFVVFEDDTYYLFVTYTDSDDKTYNDTLVFASKNPLCFGEYQGDETLAITKLHCHAPEIIKVKDKYYITTCGWKGRPVVNAGSVSMAELKFE